MTATTKGIVLAAIGAAVNLFLILGLWRPLLNLSWGAAGTMAAVGVIGAALFGFLTGRKEIYSWEPRAIWAFMLDVSWSALNTVTGLVWMIYCAAKGSFAQPTAETQKRGIITFSGAALPGADATTIGTVMGGKWLVHEAVHVQQARIFGPFYWPLYLVSYATNMLVRFLTGRFHDPHWQAYGRVLMEDWAYRAAPKSKIELFPSILWGLIAGVNGVALAVLIAHIPVIGAIPDALGFDSLPWWLGLIVIVVYALGRSFMPKGNDDSAEVVFT